jgi:hypothetical protein
MPNPKISFENKILIGIMLLFRPAWSALKISDNPKCRNRNFYILTYKNETLASFRLHERQKIQL